MQCTSCATSAPPHELADGKCLKCLHQENTIFRLLIGHTIMAIASGTATTLNGKTVFRQDFNEEFLEHLKTVLVGVNTQSTQNQKSDPVPA